MTETAQSWLLERLPSELNIPLRGEFDYYGALHQAILQLGLPHGISSSVTCRSTSWKHGWTITRTPVYLKEIAHGGGLDCIHLVANSREENFLRNQGCVRVHSVGMPFLYANTPKVERIPGSLLVMPAHSIKEDAGMLKWDEEEYVKKLLAIRHHFSEITASISGACVEQGLWVKTLDTYGIPWLRGASLDDANSLVRMKVIFSSFEYVTGNAIGSHVPYAALCGCKVSNWGPMPVYTREQLLVQSLFRENPNITDKWLLESREDALKKSFPFLFCPPHEAQCHEEWAKGELGYSEIKSPKFFGRLFKFTQPWRACDKMRNRVIGLKHRLSKAT